MLYELLHQRPAVRAGPSYWSISPMGRKRSRTAGGIPVGSVEDTAYFPQALQPLLSRVFAVPGEVGQAPNVEVCRYVTLWFLVQKQFVRRDDNSRLQLTVEGAEYLEQSYKTKVQRKRLQAANTLETEPT